ncbi:esterase/lipase [Mycobacterium phage Rebeuca]|uniref:Hydrolase n=2 Tax=Fromanvirus rebeuca TaxID=1225862 RepID=A0A482JHF9_9CAUD|nr:esterase/lipase [Mycobacterium phage Rebeuca]AFQ97367.1 hydrolase [Mycobacterium phage Rebeuca]QBP32008.1 hydrolase [Mycobacterium phage Kristoff]
MKRRTIVLDDGFRVGVTQHGTGTPLVFLHGLSVSARAYEELFVELGKRGFAVTALDAVNHGRTDSLPWGHTVEDMIEVTRRAIEQLGIHHAVLVGHSMGGGMVVELAARYPDMAIAAILLDAAAGIEHHQNIRVAPSSTIPFRAVQKLAGAFIDCIGDGFHGMSLRDCEENVSLLGRLRTSLSGFRFVRAAYALMLADTPPLLEKMRANSVPTAVIHGEFDQIVPLAAGESAAEAAGGKVYVVEGGFHSWMIADPGLGADAIRVALEGALW